MGQRPDRRTQQKPRERLRKKGGKSATKALSLSPGKKRKETYSQAFDVVLDIYKSTKERKKLDISKQIFKGQVEVEGEKETLLISTATTTLIKCHFLPLYIVCVGV